MILQKILFPKSWCCTDANLYYRLNTKDFRGWADIEAENITVDNGTPLYFDTLFNSFSIEKWLKYTKLNNLILEISYQGSFLLEIMTKTMVDGNVNQSILSSHILSSSQKNTESFQLASLPQKGIISFSLIALQDHSVFYGGSFCSNVIEDSLNNINIALDICTFRREAYVGKNIELINKYIINNSDSILKDNLEVYISDNGQTLDVSKLSSNSIHIYPNKNYGGAGGFGRGMYEILKSGNEFTHILVMDDDIALDPFVLERLYVFLAFMKDEYLKSKTIAGAMMRYDKMYLQHECTGIWNGNFCKPRKFKLDMHLVKNVLYNEIEEPANFNAWWFSCIPIEKVKTHKMPMPIFIRYDDVEYGLRTGSDILTLNGICVWHDPFEYKYSSSMEYYQSRNCFIINALHRPYFKKKQAKKHIITMFKSNIMRYRYNNIKLIFKGVNDFLKGPKWLMEQDADALNRQLMSMGDKFTPIEELKAPFDYNSYLNSFIYKEGKVHRLIRLLTLNGLFLPAKGMVIVSAATSFPLKFFRKKHVLNYDVIAHKGFISTKNFGTSIKLIFELFHVLFIINRKYDAVQVQYKEVMTETTSIDFWEKYLDIKN